MGADSPPCQPIHTADAMSRTDLMCRNTYRRTNRTDRTGLPPSHIFRNTAISIGIAHRTGNTYGFRKYDRKCPEK